jgi:hypothetical protein
MSEGVVGISYNTSVFGAKKFLGQSVPGFASEARFLADRPGVTYGGVELVSYNDFFKNALDHLKGLAMGHDAKVIGIQEYEPLTENQFTDRFPGWELHAFAKSVKNNAKVLTIWDPDTFGTKIAAYDADLIDQGRDEEAGGFKLNLDANGGDAGRPISIIKTTGGYFLMNFHGINRPKYTSAGAATNFDVSAMLKLLIPRHVAKAEEVLGGFIDPKKLIIMCDSNDREHGINMGAPLEINDTKFHDMRAQDKKDGAKSCCYNWDSCGKSTVPAGAGTSTMGAEGALANYAYTGDYVLGANPVEPVFVPPTNYVDSQGVSVASDHEPVIGKVRLDGLAGGRRKRRHTKRRVLRKQRKTRSGRRKSKSVRTSKYQS